MENLLRLEENIKKIENNKKNLEIKLYELSPQVQVLVSLDLKQKSIKKEVDELKEEVYKLKEEIEEIKVNNLIDKIYWRRDSSRLINTIALKIGGCREIKRIRKAIYESLEKILKVSLSTRIKNKKKSLALNGESEKKISKVNELDIIEEDKKLLECFINIVEKLAKRYKVKI